MSSTTFKPLEAPRKRFTQDEANRALVYVSKVAQDVTVVHCQVVSIRRQIEAARGQKLEPLEQDYRRLIARLRSLVRELDMVGVDLRDFEKGLVEFPATGPGLLFSWMPGDQAVTATAAAASPRAPQAAPAAV